MEAEGSRRIRRVLPFTPIQADPELSSYQQAYQQRQLLATLRELSSFVQKQSQQSKSSIDNNLKYLITVSECLKDQTEVLLKIETRLKEQSECLKTHSACLDVLRSDAIKDELPARGQDWQDPVAWRAMFQSVMSRTKEQVEIWKAGMDATLIFIALFLTVVTAFVVPATQNLSGNPTAAINITVAVLSPTNVTISSPPALSSSPVTPLPSLSDQFVCFLFYTSLIISILTALLCVYGRRWTGRLTSIPKCKTFLEKTMRHMEMKEMADRWVEPLLTLSHSSLIASIILFLAGLLFQLWSVSLAFDAIAPLLMTMCSLQTLLSLTVCFFIGATVWHAVAYMNSPFQSPFSTFLQTVATQWLRIRIPDRLNQVSLTIREWSESEDQQTWEQIQAVHLDAKSTYAQLVMDTSDPDLLALCAPSLSNIGSWDWSWVEGRTEDWPRYRDLLDSALEAAARSLEPDTSERTKLTLMGQMYDLCDRRWRYIAAQDGDYQDKIQKKFRGLLDVTRDMYRDASLANAEHRKYYFVGQYFLVNALEEDIANEWGDNAGRHEYEDVLGRALSVGFKTVSWQSANDSLFWSLFHSACGELDFLLGSNKDKARHVLDLFMCSPGGCSSVAKFLLSNSYDPFRPFEEARTLLEIIFANDDPDFPLWTDPELLEILSELPAACTRNHSGEILALEFISLLSQHLGPEYCIPEGLDLSPILALACSQYSNLRRPRNCSKGLMVLVARIPPARFIDQSALLRFLELCVTHKKVAGYTVILAEKYLAHNFPDSRVIVDVDRDYDVSESDEDECVAWDAESMILEVEKAIQRTRA
ncbi:hypothetical protein SISSUDRAFT_1060194 [Sistotremastrum suecicum HHB10207 ss-3]|uniref:DUF6535 domain-containing protein n=1 Tax=Sistotremastrum suecicum HHB10207 ss-3 TaxID=1314776 RepID=A0A166FE79_9AGAM|nr:hypothetical protein SISSUDRAFT_1060194 [Sistotremastrum suecicum HHB10207 ss-3]